MAGDSSGPERIDGQSEPPTIVSENASGDVTDTAASITQRVSYGGPLPPPAMLAQYEETISGSAERILRMAESEQTHRHAAEDKSMDYMARDVRRGQLLGAGLLFIALVASIYALIIGNNVAIGIFLGASVLSVIGRFLPRLWQRKDQE